MQSNIFGVTHLNNNKPQKVVLLFIPEQSPYVLSQPLHPSQKTVKQNSKELKVELRVFLTHELMMCILGYGSSVKVLSPQRLALHVKAEAKAVLKQYS